MSRHVSRQPLRSVAQTVVVVTVVAACSIGGRPAAVSLSASLAPSSSPSPAVADSPIPTGGQIATGPPVAALAAEGGDETDGQLGTYTWGDGGSDAPWLPGERVAVGAGEPLTVRFRPETAIETWSARVVPASADGPAGASGLGQGSGQPRFAAPGAGTWTAEVRIVFANAAGEASYFWQLAVD
jgi:hypothetical protein